MNDDLLWPEDIIGMTLNERLFAAGLLDEFDAAARRRDREAMIAIFQQVALPSDGAAWSVDTILANPARYVDEPAALQERDLPMAIGKFTDKQHPPTPDEVRTALGPRRATWECLIEFILARYRVQRDWRYYGKNYGWAERIRKGGKALLSLYPGQDAFTAQVVLDEQGVQEALKRNIGFNARHAIESAKPYPEGRWLFVPVESDRDAEDVKYFLSLKA
jgi:hypothetical protein